jgi:hypothetical protein
VAKSAIKRDLFIGYQIWVLVLVRAWTNSSWACPVRAAGSTKPSSKERLTYAGVRLNWLQLLLGCAKNRGSRWTRITLRPTTNLGRGTTELARSLHFFFFWGGAFQAAHAPQKPTDPALAGSAHTAGVHWRDRHTPALSSRRRTGRRDPRRRRTRHPSCLRRSLEHQTH